jgi:hypothetical protein
LWGIEGVVETFILAVKGAPVEEGVYSEEDNDD